MNRNEVGLLRTAAFHAAQEYPPSYAEWIAHSEVPRGTLIKGVEEAAERLLQEGRVQQRRGRIILPGHAELVTEHEARRDLFHQKIRKAQSVARGLTRQKSIRFVALCNTTALAHARADSDLDFFIITTAGTVWQSRLLSVLPYKLMGKRPEEGRRIEDAVCLSFFLDEIDLNLSELQIQKQGAKLDPYLRYWFLSLLPLYDDGVGDRLWKENGWITERHGLAERWLPHRDIMVSPPFIRVPSAPWLERKAKQLQTRSFPQKIREAANRGTNVVIHDRMLKFHTTDRREQFRDAYERNCRALHIEP